MDIIIHRSFFLLYLSENILFNPFSDNYSLFGSLIFPVNLYRFQVNSYVGFCPELFF